TVACLGFYAEDRANWNCYNVIYCGESSFSVYYSELWYVINIIPRRAITITKHIIIRVTVCVGGVWKLLYADRQLYQE
ncbi:AAEL011294-PA, partial [Aedes aegypti]